MGRKKKLKELPKPVEEKQPHKRVEEMSTFGVHNSTKNGQFIIICKKCGGQSNNTVHGICSECVNKIATTNFGLKEKLSEGRGVEAPTNIKVKME